MASAKNERAHPPLVALACAAGLVIGGFRSGSAADGRRPIPAPADKGTIRLAVSGATNSGVSVAAADQAVVVTWAATRGSTTDIYAAASRDGGASFEPPRRVNDADGDARVNGEQAPRVAMGRGVEIVWLSKAKGASRVRAARSVDGGRTFAPATTVHAEDLPGARGWQSLAVNRGGAIHVAWLDGREAHAPPASPGGGHGKHAPMRQDVFQAVWRPDGTHDEIAVATDVCFCCKTAVATAPDGATYVAWRHIYPTNLRDVAVARSVDGGRTFAAPVRVSEDHWQIDGCPDDGPSMAVDPAGVVHIVWPTLIQGEAPGKAVFYSFSSDGGRTFAPRMRVDDARSSAGHPQVALGGNRVAVVWDQSGEQRGAYVREIAPDSKARSWTPRMGAISALGTERSAFYPAVAATSTSIIAAWTERADPTSEIRVRRIPWAPPGSSP
jgi:hypothetical protein